MDLNQLKHAEYLMKLNGHCVTTERNVQKKENHKSKKYPLTTNKKIPAHLENTGKLDNKKTNLTWSGSAMISSFTEAFCQWAHVLGDTIISQFLPFGNTDELHV